MIRMRLKMLLNLNRKQKMNFNMMCKKIIAATAILIICVNIISVKAAEKEDYIPQGEGEILLVYSDKITSEEKNDIEYLNTLSSSLNRSLDFGTADECKNVLDKYDYIICYNIKDSSLEFKQEIKEYKGKLMILGSDFMSQYITVTNQKDEYIEENSQTKGKLEYSFNEDKFQEIVELENLKKFQINGYKNGNISVGSETFSFCSQIGNVRFIPVTNYSGNLVKAALMQEIVQWLWPYLDKTPDYAQYMVLDKVYPFMSAEKLKKKVDLLVNADIPFVISVMPITENADYPSMKQFCQILKYAQVNGGAIILNSPIVHTNEKNQDEVYELLTEMTLAYTNNGVYPLGIEVPVSWTNEDFYLDILKRYRTLFVYDDGEKSGFKISDHRNKLFYNYHQLVMPLIPLDKTGVSYLKSYSSALYLDSAIDVEELKEKIDYSKSSSVPFKNLWDMNQSVWANNFHLNYENYVLKINDVEINPEFKPEAYDEDYNYGRNTLQRITVSLKNQNKGLMIVAFFTISIFIILIVYSRRKNRKHFFYDDEKE
jgi:uncharacterized protein YdaL